MGRMMDKLPGARKAPAANGRQTSHGHEGGSRSRLRGAFSHRTLLAGGIGVVMILAAAGILLVFQGSGSRTPTVNNESRNYRACLMADAADATDAQAVQAVWAGLQRAAATGKVNAERLPLGSSDPDTALPYFNGAVEQHCGIIVSVGSLMKTATESAAAKNPGQRFMLVGVSSARTNVVTVTMSDASTVSGAVYTDIMNAAVP